MFYIKKKKTLRLVTLKGLCIKLYILVHRQALVFWSPAQY